jgi:CHAT domain-containing protein
MKLRKSLIVFICTLTVCFVSAQTDVVPAGSKLSTLEIEQLRNVLKELPPVGSSTQQIDQHYRKHDAAAFKLGDMKERERVLREWSEASTDLDARWTYASLLFNTEKIQEGLVLFEALVKDTKTPDSQIRSRARLAIVYIDQSNLKRGQELLDEASEIIKRTFNGSRSGAGAYWYLRAEMEYHNIRARLMLRQGRLDEALETSKLAHAKGEEMYRYENFTDKRQREYSRAGHAWVVTETAMIQTAMGRLFDADDSLRRAYALYKKYELTEDTMVDFYRRVASLRFNEGHYAESLKVYEVVMAIQKRQRLNPASSQILYTRNGINMALVAQKKWGDALVQYDQIDTLTSSSNSLLNIARQTEPRAMTYLNTGRVSQALQLMTGTLRWHITNFGEDHYYTAITRGMYAMTLAASDNKAYKDLALNEFERAFKGMTMPNTLSVDYQESPYRLELKKTILNAYLKQLSQSDSLNDKSIEQAFLVANASISSSVQQAISEAAARTGVKQPKLKDVVRKDQVAKNELTLLYSYIAGQGSEGSERRNPKIVKTMRSRITELEDVRKNIKVELQRDYPDYFQLLQPKTPAPKDIAKLLKRDEVFISLLPTPDATYLFAISSDGKVLFNKSRLTQPDIRLMVNAVRSTLDVADQGVNAPAFDVKTSFELYQNLLKPLQPLMQGKRHLIIATSGVLGQLPFSVLNTQAPVPDTNTAWLIKQFSISHIPSANAWISLKHLEETPSGSQAMIAWGDPLFNLKLAGASVSASNVRSVLTQRQEDSLDLTTAKVDLVRYADVPPLPETRDEVLALAKTLNADPIQDVYLGKFATRESVLIANREGKLGNKKVVVFATHGLLPGDMPHLDQPALALAATEKAGESPLLTLEDVLNLNLNADWVVLSACNTAGADGRVEEAMSGLARGFFYAGSRSLLVTHWSVESESAMLLTTLTFSSYQKDPKVNRAEALRLAMLTVMKDKRFAHPAFWAPYALVGEGGR